MFYSYHVPQDFEQDWHTVGEKMERYFAHPEKSTSKVSNTVKEYARASKGQPSQLTVFVKIAAVLLIALFMLTTLCYFMALDREHISASPEQDSPKFELKSDFFSQAAYAHSNQNSQEMSGCSQLPHYQAAFGLPRRFGCED